MSKSGKVVPNAKALAGEGRASLLDNSSVNLMVDVADDDIDNDIDVHVEVFDLDLGTADEDALAAELARWTTAVDEQSADLKKAVLREKIAAMKRAHTANTNRIARSIHGSPPRRPIALAKADTQPEQSSIAPSTVPSSKPKAKRTRKKTKKVTQRHPGGQTDSIPDSSAEGGSLEDSIIDEQIKCKDKSKQFQSGVNAKGSDIVKNPQIWAHSALAEDHTESATPFAQLSFRLFVAGEMEIVLEADLPQLERRGRLMLIRKMSYLLGSYDWNVILNVYGTVLRKIERGLATWCSDFDSTIYMILMTGGNKPKSQSLSSGQKSAGYAKKLSAPGGKKTFVDSEKTWYCLEFQHNNCALGSTHQAIRFGKPITVHHICAKCWSRDRKEVPHADTNPICPHFEH